MRRYSLYLFERQIRLLSDLRASSGIAVAERIRRAIDTVYPEDYDGVTDRLEAALGRDRATVRAYEVYLPPQQIRRLESLRDDTSISVSQLLRWAIDKVYGTPVSYEHDDVSSRDLPGVPGE